MTNIKKLVIIRHGETEWNIERKLQGQKDSNLTELGKRQTELVAKSLKDEKFDRFYSSDLERCIVTSELINRYHNKEIIYDWRLRERNFGVLQGMTKEDIERNEKDIYEKYRKGNINFEVKGGESFEEFFKRTMYFFNEITTVIKKEKILIVTHGGVLDCLIRKTTGMDLNSPRCFTIYNSSINRFLINNGNWKIETWGDINHLRNVLTIDDF